MLAFTEEPAWCRRRRWSTQSWAVPFHTEHQGIGHRHSWPKSRWKLMTWRDRLLFMYVPQWGLFPGRRLPNWRLHSRRWASMSIWCFVIPENRDGGQCCQRQWCPGPQHRSTYVLGGFHDVRISHWKVTPLLSPAGWSSPDAITQYKMYTVKVQIRLPSRWESRVDWSSRSGKTGTQSGTVRQVRNKQKYYQQHMCPGQQTSTDLRLAQVIRVHITQPLQPK